MPTSFYERHPVAVDRILSAASIAVTIVPAATITALLAGHAVLAGLGVFASIGFYATGYATAVIRCRRACRAAVDAARRDPLTGLPNRAVADEMLDEAARTDTPTTVALLDVNGLHTINANLGHAAGDRYLTIVAERLAIAVPPGGVLVRQGGDEFTLLAPDTSPQELADRIGAALAGPAVLAGYRIQPRAAVGIAHTTVADGAGMVDARHARARADSAMYTAKRDGGNQIRIFDPDRDLEPFPDGTRPLLRRRDVNPLAETGLGWLPAPTDDLIPVLLATDELRAMAQALTNARDRWAQAAAQAQAGMQRPASPDSSDPGWMNVEPNPAGYAGIAGLARAQHNRYTRLLDRLQSIIEAADSRDDAAGSITAAPPVSCVVLAGISAAFGPADIEALVITAAKAVCGRPDDLSSRQRELAARAYDLLQDVIDG
jgi:diguanylate cyclase (GGDEF)-like protein